tara:strand:+ start:173 stop:1348 length:1176 start_codon:yes stop_codon:yes gene_type:complete
MIKYDVIIIGSGPVGLSLAKSLSNSSFSVCVIDRQTKEDLSEPTYDGREVAITHYSKRILKEIGSWDLIDDDCISYLKEAKVINGHSPYSLHFNFEETNQTTLGYLIPNHKIKSAIFSSVTDDPMISFIEKANSKTFNINQDGVQVELESGDMIHGDLLVAADGRLSGSRRQMGIASEVKDFGKTVIVCKMDHEIEHENIAYECFHYGRTLAVLPMVGKQCSVVITVHSDKAKEILDQDDMTFSLDIAERFNHRLGKMSLASDKYSYPLFASHADHFHAERFALVGDASVGMHPVTAHGFNLGLRGIDTLTRVLNEAKANNESFYSQENLKKYNQTHQMNTRTLYYGTNLIVDLFNSERSSAKFMRRLALRFGNNVWPIKKMIMDQLTETK